MSTARTDWNHVARLMNAVDDGTEYALDRILSNDTASLRRELRRREHKRQRREHELPDDIVPERFKHKDSYDWVVLHFSDALSSGQCALLAARMEGFTMRELAVELECSHATVCRMFASLSRKLFQDGRLDAYKG